VKRAFGEWFAARSWKPFKFQREVWKAIGEDRSGLLHATTGAGKTYAVWFGALQALAPETPPKKSPPLTVLWLTPLRALAADTLRALQQPLETLRPVWGAGARSGDTGPAERSAQNQRLPTVLVTTPESLSLLLARADAKEVLGALRMVVVDEWHELLGNKRGVQVQLALARLGRWNAGLCVWGMSATLGNLQDAMRTLLGGDEGVLVQGEVPKELVVDSLLPGHAERFPGGGHRDCSGRGRRALGRSTTSASADDQPVGTAPGRPLRGIKLGGAVLAMKACTALCMKSQRSTP
jgi:ATP-dependent Lhr-like helicase